MKINIKALQLIEKGLTAKTVSRLTESEISILHSRLISEQVKREEKKINVTTIPASVAKTSGVEVEPGKKVQVDNKGDVVITTATEGEMKEDETDDVTDKNALGADALQNLTGQEAPHMANDMGCDGMDDDSCNDRKMMGMSEEKKKEQNPWAICTAQLGKEFGTRERHMWSAKEKNKYERCVKDVKKSLKEGKNPVSSFLESKIMTIVEKNIPARITKGDLMKFLQEDTKTAPTKPKTSPKTRPDEKPKTRPKHPGKNPNPGENPAPKAVSPEKAKDEVLDLIMKLLEN